MLTEKKEHFSDALFSLHLQHFCYIIKKTLEWREFDMLESLRQLYDNIVDFCREQSDAMMIGGAVLVVLIILIAVVRYFLKQDNSKQEADEALEFDEKQYLDKLLGAEAEKESQEEAQTKTQEEVQTETQIKENLTEKKEYPYKKNIIFPDELIDEITKASAQNLQEIEIKIQSAELRIRYAGYQDKGEVQEEVKHFDSAADSADKEKEQDGDAEAVETESSAASEETEEILKQKIEPAMIAEESIKHIKFGPENFNIDRNGKAYTEEELEKQIRD